MLALALMVLQLFLLQILCECKFKERFFVNPWNLEVNLSEAVNYQQGTKAHRLLLE